MPDLEIKCSRCGSHLHHECHPDTVQWAAVDLFMWRPESGFPKEMKKHGDGSEQDATVPFLTESFLYPLLGKEDARTLMSLVDNLFRAMGVEPHAYREKAWALIDKKKRNREEEERQRAEGRKRYREEMQPISEVRRTTSSPTICDYRSFYCFDANVHACEEGRCMARAGEGNHSEKKKPKLGEVDRDPVLGMSVECHLCKRVHNAVLRQVEHWKEEPRYQATKARLTNDPGFKPQDWIASDAIAKAFGFNRD
jgi:hypothetical protein